MKRHVLLLLACLVALSCGAQTTQVALRGQGVAEGILQGGIYTYKGIPYARAERFMPPEAPASWVGVRSFTDYGPICPQGMVMGFGQAPQMDDDCQNLNIWTPAIHDGGKRPVMLWLHGGGFESGSSRGDSSDGANLSRRGDVVIVSINHRLNILGHLDLSAYGEKYASSGNVGILDIMAALEWVKANITSFGGDPDNITLFGESGGGAKIIVLNAMPSAHGLFRRGIIESGAVESLGMLVTEQSVSRQVTECLLQKLDLSPENIEKLKDVPYADLNAAGNQALREVGTRLGLEDGFRNPGNMSWAPVVDGRLLPTQPVKESSAFFSRDIPLIIGTNLSEMNFSFGGNGDKTTWSAEEKDRRLQERFGKTKEAVVAAFRKAYPDRDPVDAICVDSWIRSNSLRYLGLRSREGGAPVFSYLFAFDNPQFPAMLVPHTAEIPYVFGNLGGGMMAPPASGETKQMSDTMMDAWIAFARTGNPSTDSLQWPAFTAENRATMVFGPRSEARYGFDDELIQLLVPDYVFIP